MLDSSVKHIDQTVSSVTSSLLSRARCADRQAWEMLVELHSPLVYRWCRQQGLSAEDARDVGQEVFVAVSKNLDRFRRDTEDATFRGWLRTITNNKIRDHWRRVNKEPHIQHNAELHPTVAWPIDEPSDALQLGDQRTIFLRILEFARDRVSNLHWNVFWRVVVDECSPADVAAEFNIERHNVYIIKSRILRLLREVFDTPPEDQPG